MAFCVIDRLPDDSVTITRSPSRWNTRIFEKRAIWSTPGVRARIRREDHSGVERHGNAIGHGDSGVGRDAARAKGIDSTGTAIVSIWLAISRWERGTRG